MGPTAGDNERRQLTLHARQARFFVRTATPTTYGDVNTHVEFDLFGSSGNESVSNSHNLRLRHAYGTIGGLLAGQTWSNFMMVSAGPQTLDFGGPVGQTFIRQSQLRWTQPFSGGQWSVALENPESGVTLANGTGFRADDDRLPDLTANVGFKTSYGEFALAGVVWQIRTDSATPATRDSRTGGGIAAYGVIPVVGSDTVSFTVAGGNGSDFHQSDLAARWLGRNVFEDKTFADMAHGNLPLVIINASDLNNGSAFSFIQPHFDFLSSSLTSYPAAHAVMESAAVPVAFAPIALRNYPPRR